MANTIKENGVETEGGGRLPSVDQMGWSWEGTVKESPEGKEWSHRS